MRVIESKAQIGNDELSIFVEVDEDAEVAAWFTEGETRSDGIRKVNDLLGNGLRLVRNCAVQVVDQVNQMADTVKPNEFDVQFAVKLDSEVGAVIAKAKSGAQMKVTMKWKLKE